jgi:hypothetical protein
LPYYKYMNLLTSLSAIPILEKQHFLLLVV